MFKVSYQGKSSTLIQFIKLDGLSSKETLKHNGGEPILHFPENSCQRLFLYKHGLQNDIFFSNDLLYYHMVYFRHVTFQCTGRPYCSMAVVGRSRATSPKTASLPCGKGKIPDKNEKYLSGHVNV